MSPSDQECVVNGIAVFTCQPSLVLVGTNVTVVWLVNGSSVLNSFPGFTVTAASGGRSELQVIGCVPEWNGTSIQCVLSSPFQTVSTLTSSTLTVPQQLSEYRDS